MTLACLASSVGFGLVDWLVVAGVLLATTWVGARKAGHQSGPRDFFLGGRNLPWYAVGASIVATEISAVTYVSLPAVVFGPSGDLTYLQVVLFGSLIARGLIAWKLVPLYFEHEIYSPYDFVGRRLGEGARRLVTAVFTLGGLLAQSARVYVTALVLEVLLRSELAAFEQWCGLPPLATAVALIAIVAIAWTWMGGIAAVVWTDAILFLMFAVGAGVTLFVVDGRVDGGLSGIVESAAGAGKLRLVDASFDWTRAYTLWAALIAVSWGSVASYGVDQLLAQRILCCRDVRDARRAVLSSFVGVLIVGLIALVGVALWGYYQAHPLSAESAGLVAERGDRIFPLFITEVVPAGLRGLVVAGVFAAAISSLDSILAALTQTTLSLFWSPGGDGGSGAGADSTRLLRRSRWLLAGWGIVLSALAVGLQVVAERYDAVLDLALAMAGYTGGALLAAVALAHRQGGRDGGGLRGSAPLSMLFVFAAVWHEDWALRVCLIGGAALAVDLAWRLRSRGAARRAWLSDFGALALGLGLVFALQRFAVTADGRVLAWPWYIPLGSLVAYGFGWWWSRPKSSSAPLRP